MRILHTSDWHLGLDFYGAPLLEDQEHVLLHGLAQVAQRERADAVLIAGDVFDRAVVAPDAIALYNRIMERLVLEMGLRVAVCAGNHDGAARLSALSALLRRAGLHIAGRVGPQEEVADWDGAAIHLLPYVATDDARAACPHRREEIASAVDAMRVLLQERTPPRDGRRHILLAHCFAAGGQAGTSDRAAAVGGAIAAPTAWFEGYDYAALGHLHRMQSLAGGRVRYCGAPLCYSFGEEQEGRGVTLLDTEEMRITPIAIPPLRRVYSVKGSMDRLLEGGAEDYVRLVVEDQLASASVQEALRRRYPRAMVIESGLARPAGAADGLTLVQALSAEPLEIAEKFYLKQTGLEMNEEQRAWFRRAVEDAEREE